MVRFGAAIDGMSAGVERVTEMIESLTGPVKALQSTFAELGESILAAFAVEKVAEFVEHQAELADQIVRTSAILGSSVSETQQLGFVAKVSGTSTEALAMSMSRLEVSVQRAANPMSVQAKALSALGLSARDFAGLSIEDKLLKIADAFHDLSERGINPTSAGMILMSRGAIQMTPLLERGREAVEELFASLDKVGGVIGSTFIANLEATDEQIGTLSQAWINLKGTMAGFLAPAFQGFIAVLIDVIAAMKRSVDEGGAMQALLVGIGASLQVVDITLAVAVETLRGFWEVTKTVVYDVGESFMKLGRIMKDVFTLNWSDVAPAWDELQSNLRARTTIMAIELKNIVADAKHEIETALTGLPAPKLPAGDQTALNLGINTDALRAAAEQIQALIREAQEAYTTATKLADDQFNQTKQHLSAELAQHQITYAQETAALDVAVRQRYESQVSALEQQYAAQAAAFDKLAALYPRDSAQWQKALIDKQQAFQKFTDQLVLAEAKMDSDLQKNADDLSKNYVQQWTSAADQVAGAFNSQLKQLLAGQETFGTAMKNISSQIVLKFIEDQIKATAEYLAQLAERVAAALSAAPILELANITGGTGGGVGGGILGVLAGGIGKLFTAAVSGQGTAIGALAAGGLVGFQEGAWEVPAGGGFTHPGEMVLPQSLAESVRSGQTAVGTAGTSGASPTIHINGPVIGNQAWINSMVPQLSRALSNYATYNPSQA